jgi:hypothetical protein
MAWGYRLEVMGARETARCREDGRGCAVSRCQALPLYNSAYRYARAAGRLVTTTRPLCGRHARLFSMKFSLAWPSLSRRARRPVAAGWTQLAA